MCLPLRHLQRHQNPHHPSFKEEDNESIGKDKTLEVLLNRYCEGNGNGTTNKEQGEQCHQNAQHVSDFISPVTHHKVVFALCSCAVALQVSQSPLLCDSGRTRLACDGSVNLLFWQDRGDFFGPTFKHFRSTPMEQHCGGVLSTTWWCNDLTCSYLLCEATHQHCSTIAI